MDDTAMSGRWELDGRSLRVSHLDRVYWPDTGQTKGELLRYYRTIAPWILPYLTGRPVTLKVYPRGIDAPGYYRRALPSSAPKWLRSTLYHPQTRAGELRAPLIDNLAELIWHANRGAIEVHIWLSRENALTHPDWAVFDLDPGPSVPFTRVLEAALAVRAMLDELGVVSFPKTSGASGMHLMIPIEPARSFQEVRDWVHEIARRLATKHPGLVAVAANGTHDASLVTVDHAQNSIARNLAAPYTARATPNATVSTPLSWQEIRGGKIRPDDFTINSVPARLAQLDDPWRGALSSAQRLPEL